MTAPDPQPPAAPETDVNEFADVRAELTRARAPRLSSCCYSVGTPECRCVPTCYIPADRVAALLADLSAARERLREVESERDEWRRLAHGELARAESAEAERDRRKREAEVAVARMFDLQAERDDLRARLLAMRQRIWALGESIYGEEGVEHNEGCEGEPDCLACIVADLRAVLASPSTHTQRDTETCRCDNRWISSGGGHQCADSLEDTP